MSYLVCIWLAGKRERGEPRPHMSDKAELYPSCTSSLNLPSPSFSLAQRVGDLMESFDPLAYALTLHALGRMRQRRMGGPLARDLLEASEALLPDFSPGPLPSPCCLAALRR